MLKVTDAALQHLHSALTKVNAVDSTCFRFTQSTEESVGIIVQKPEPTDQTFECDGDTVLAAPEPLSELLSKKILDLDDDGQLVLLPKAA
jgi:hypothetical protein